MANFDDLQGAVAQFGANNKVIFDDTGMPSIMVAVPKAKYSDVITGGTDETLPFWIMDGEEKSVIYVSKFLNIVENDRAYSLGGYLPRNYINFDQSVAACKKKGAGWHLNQTGIFAYLNLLSQKMGTVPHGNTNYGKDYYHPWVNAESIKELSSKAHSDPASVSKGDIVTFTGGGVYKSSTAEYASVQKNVTSTCKVTAVNTKGTHPYHCISQDGKGVYGWVNAADVK